MKNLDNTLAKIIFVLCLITWMLWPKQAGAQINDRIVDVSEIRNMPVPISEISATASNGQKSLSIEDVKKCVAFDGHMKTSVFGILDATYAIAISEGKTKEQAAEIAAKKLGELLNEIESATSGQILYPAKMPMGEYYPYPSRTQIRPTADHRGDITSSPTGFWMMDADTVGVGAIKKDTILVDVLCTLVGETHVPRESIVISEPWHEQKQFGFVPYVTSKRQERTLEWQRVSLPSSYKNGMTLGIYSFEQKYVVIETRWLDPIGGCYQLTPIEH